jgi:hypothetical protein
MLTRSLVQWFQSACANSLRRIPRRRSMPWRTERLEDRCVPAVFLVTTTLDTVDANPGDGIAADVNGETSLRAAIQEANVLAGSDTIQLPAGTYAMTIAAVSTEDFSTDGDFDITSNITIQGDTAANTIIDANQLDRLFDVTSAGSLFLSRLTLRNGLATVGGAIKSLGSVDIRDSVLTGNRATIRGGAIETQGVTGVVLGVYDTTFSNNLANGNANPATPSGNGIGGAISASGSMQTTLSRVTLSNNMAAGEGGALDARSLSSLTIVQSAFSGNRAAAGGAIRLSSVPTSITGTSFNGDNAVSTGGAIRSNFSNITMSRATFDNVFLTNPNGAGSAGGVLHLTGTSSTANTTSINYSEFRNSGGGDGGAIYNSFNNVIVTNSTFENASGGRLGGAIYNASGGRLSVRNTTITGSTGTLGGAIYNSGSGGFLVNNTITGNTSLGNAGAAGAAVQSNGSAPVAVNNIFAGNTGGDVSGSYDSQGGNVIGVVGTATGFFSIADFGGDPDLLGTAGAPINPQLSPLANNGGLVRTMAIAPTSPARDHGTVNGNVSPTDARDVSRSPSNKPDAGAYEYVNNAPVASSVTYTFAEDTTFTGQLPGTDADGDTLTYTLLTPPQIIPGTLVFNTNGSFTYTPNANVNGVVAIFDYKVSDGRVESTAYRVTMQATPVNDAPVVNDQSFSVAENSAALALIGFIANTDAENNPRTIAFLSGNESGAFIIGTTNGAFGVLDPAQFNFETTPVRTFTVRVTETGTGLFDDATITVNLTDVNEAPVFFTGTRVLAENAAAGTSVANLGASDPDAGQTLTYTLVAGNTGGAFTVDSNGNLVVANAAAIDFETNPRFTLDIAVMDNATQPLSVTRRWTINLSNVLEAPTVASAIFGVDETAPVGTVVGDVVADPEDANEALFYVLEGTGAGTVFAIAPLSGRITLIAPLDYESTSSYALTVTVYDSGIPSQSASAPVTINVIDFNEAPVLYDGSTFVAENSPNGTLVADLGASDPNPGQTLVYAITDGNVGGAFAIDAEGNLIVADATAINHEVRPAYSLTITATDDGQPSLTTTATWVVAVANRNDRPVVTGGPFSIAENAPSGTVVGSISATDEDADAVITYVITGTTGPAGLFTVDSATGEITLQEALDYEATTSYTLTFTIYDGSGDQNPPTHTVVINVTNANEAPVVSGGSFSLLETAQPNPPVVLFDVDGTDPDAGQSLTYSIVGGNTNSRFTIVPSTGQIFLSASLSYETTPVYNLQVRVTDNGNPALFTTVTVVANIIDVNEAPVVAGGTYSAPENSAIGRPTGGATGVDFDIGQTLTYEIIAGNTGTAFAINPNTGAISVAGPLDFETKSQYVLTVRVTDNGTPALSGTGTVTINITNVNDAPTVTGGPLTIAENPALGTLVGSAVASDQDAGQTITYSITSGNVGNKFAINSSTGRITVIGGLNYEVLSTYSLVVTATDNGVPALSGQGTITVNVTDVNDRPAIAGGSLNLAENSAAGTVVTSLFPVDDDPGQTLSYVFAAGNVGGAFAVDAQGRLVVANTAAVDFETTPVFVLDIIVSDNGSPSLSSTNRWFINLLNRNDAPTVAASTFTIAELSAAGTDVGTVSAADQDAGQTLSYAITSGNESGTFAINAATGAITLAGPVDFELTTSYTLVVTATDSFNPAASGSGSVTVNVTDVNEAPVPNSPSFSIAENSATGTVVGAVSATDIDAGQSLSFAITSGNTSGAFAINATTGQITVAGSLDAEVISLYSLVVSVTDNGSPALSANTNISILIDDVNEAPTVGAGSFNVDENSASGSHVGYVSASDQDIGQTLVYSILSGNEAGKFAIDGVTGQITVVGSLDFEAVPAYALVVQATDSASPALSGSGTITIAVNDRNEAPTLAAQSFFIAENSPAGTAVGTMLASDVDAGTTLTYSITGGNTGGVFAINASTGAITVVAPAALDFEVITAVSLVVSVSDNGSPAPSATAVATINLTNVNEAPTVNAATFSLAENSANGTAVGTVSASDPDAGQTRTFSIVSGNTGGAFAINATTGAITVANAAALNFEGTPSFALVIRATDNGSPALSGTATVTINLTNVNEAPVVTAATFSLAENSANGTAVGTVSASDPDVGQTRTFSIVSGNTGGAFAINATTGAITVANVAALDFETTPVFNLAVRATDNGSPSLSGQAVVTINLTNVIETQAVLLDIVPGNSSNTIRLNSSTFKVAILSTSTFDARTVNVNSVRFGEVGTEDSVSLKKGKRIFEYRDVNGDGRLDLVLTINTAAASLEVGDTLARLTGSTTGGQAIAGQGTVNVVRR